MADNPAGKVPVFAVWRGAWAFLAAHWRTFVPAALAMAVISQIGRAATAMMGGGTAAILDFAILVPMILAGLMFSGAVLRKAVRDDFIPPIGMALGADEGRLLGVGASVTLLLMPVALLAMIILSFTVMRSIAATPEELEALAADPQALMQAIIDGLGMGGLAAIAMALLVVFSIVMGLTALADAATIGEKRIMIFQAWSWMQGNVFRILGLFVLTAAPIIVINTATGEAIMSLLLGVSGGSVSLLPYLLALTLITFLNVLASIPVSAMGALLYKGLRPPDLAAR